MSDERPTHIDLFSGIGGFALAAEWAGFRTIAFCEIDKYCQAVLAERFGAVMANSNCTRRRGGNKSVGTRQETALRSPEIHTDIRTLDGRLYTGAALLTGGFPCQPFSVAGKRAGTADDRYLWPEMCRVIAEARPAWVLGENVAGIINMELDTVLSDLEAIGYATWPLVIPACAVDARHRRDRVWIVGHANSRTIWKQSKPLTECCDTSKPFGPSEALSDAESIRGRQATERRESGQSMPELGCENVADSISTRLEKRQGKRSNPCEEQPATERSGREWCEWLTEPDVGRVANGVSARVDRLKGLGNAIVPQVAFQILKTIRGLI